MLALHFVCDVNVGEKRAGAGRRPASQRLRNPIWAVVEAILGPIRAIPKKVIFGIICVPPTSALLAPFPKAIGQPEQAICSRIFSQLPAAHPMQFYRRSIEIGEVWIADYANLRSFCEVAGRGGNLAADQQSHLLWVPGRHTKCRPGPS